MRSACLMFVCSTSLGGCGLSYSHLPEPWDRAVSANATYDMEVQVKQAIYCELKRVVRDIKSMKSPARLDNAGRNLATRNDDLFPDDWGVLMQLTLQAEEKSNLTPGLSLKTPLHNVPVNFPGETIGATGALAARTYGPLSVGQSYSLGFGGQISSDNTRSDKFNTYYSAKQLKTFPPTPNTGTGPCADGKYQGSTISSSSPFLDASNLGIRDWLTSAVKVIAFERSSRAADNGEGPPLQATGAASDTSTSDNKFIIITDANIAPNWNLVRIGTPSSPLFDASRTRTHELILTVGPSSTPAGTKEKQGKLATPIATLGQPSFGALQAFEAALIGSAVANALRPQ